MLGVVEFKRHLGTCMDALPEKYDVLDYKPIKPQFLTNSDESDTNAVDSSTVGSLDDPPDQTRTSEQMPTFYSAAMLTANAAVNHVISFTVCDDVIWIWFYDHLGIIGGEGINFVQDLPRFMVLLYALQRFRMKEWGRMPEFKVHESGKATEVIFKLQLGGQLLLPGRGTDVREVPLEDHVPYMVWSNKFSISTATLRKGLGVDSANVGSRTLRRAIVFPELRPFHQLVGMETLKTWWECVSSHRVAWKAGFHHGDIIPTNVTYYRRNGEAIGVLTDWKSGSGVGCV